MILGAAVAVGDRGSIVRRCPWAARAVRQQALANAYMLLRRTMTRSSGRVTSRGVVIPLHKAAPGHDHTVTLVVSPAHLALYAFAGGVRTGSGV